MKKYSRVLSYQSLENIDLLKLASEASQENFEKKIVFLTTKYVQIVKLEHLLCPKVGGGGAQTHLCPPPTFESGEARAPPPPCPLLLHPWRFYLHLLFVIIEEIHSRQINVKKTPSNEKRVVHWKFKSGQRRSSLYFRLPIQAICVFDKFIFNPDIL